MVLIFEIEGTQSYQGQILNLAQPKDEKLQKSVLVPQFHIFF